MNVLRSLAFYCVFYAGTLVLSLATVIALPLGRERFRHVPDAWSRFHRWCVRALLGIRVVEQGTRPGGAALYAFKHEAFFEAIDVAESVTTDCIAFTSLVSRDCTSPPRVRVKKLRGIRCRWANTWVRRPCMTCCPTRVDIQVCTTPMI